MSIAWRLAQRKMRVVVLEAGRVGGEASWAGAGMLAPGGEVGERSALASLAVESLSMYADFVGELRSETGAPIDYRRCGAFEIAENEEDWDRIRERAARQHSLGIASESAGDLRLFYPDEAVVDPRDVVHALRLACERRGVRIQENMSARHVRMEAGRIVSPWPAAHAIIAAGAWSGAIPVFAGDRRVPTPSTRPVRGHLISYQLDHPSPGPILRSAHAYVLQRASGAVIAGSSTEEVGFDRSIDSRIVSGIERRAALLVPRLASLQRTAAWLGFRPATENGEPCIGALEDLPVRLAYGHYRNGILLAPVTAQRIARSLTSSSQTGSPASASIR